MSERRPRNLIAERQAPVVIDPVRLHVDSDGDAGPVMARACYTFQLGSWRGRRRRAEMMNDFAEMDRLDSEYERLGLP